MFPFPLPQLRQPGVHLVHLVAQLLLLGAELLHGAVRRAVGRILQLDAGEVEGVEQGVHLLVGLLCGEVHPVHPPGAQRGGDKEDVLLPAEGVAEAVVGLPGQIAVPEPGEIQAHQLIQADVEPPQVLELVHHAAGLVGFVLQLLPLFVEVGCLPGELVEIGPQLLQGCLGIKGGVIQGDARLIGHLHRPPKQGGIGILRLQGPQAPDVPHHLQGVFRMKFLVDDAGPHHLVKPLQRSGDGEQLHRDNGHGESPSSGGTAQPPTRFANSA